MKVKELIAKLGELCPDDEVLIWGPESLEAVESVAVEYVKQTHNVGPVTYFKATKSKTVGVILS